MPPPTPYSVPIDLGALAERGAEVTLEPDLAERAAIAEWLGVSGLESFGASISISRAGSDVYAYAASFAADVVQACVVTLQPVRSRLEGEVSRRYRMMARPPRRQSAASHEIPITAEDEPEILTSFIVDLAAPVLEELSLALDPYPRVPGAVFDVPDEEKSVSASPFAVLERLKLKANARPPVTPKIASPAKRKALRKTGKKAPDKADNGD